MAAASVASLSVFSASSASRTSLLPVWLLLPLLGEQRLGAELGVGQRSPRTASRRPRHRYGLNFGEEGVTPSLVAFAIPLFRDPHRYGLKFGEEEA